ncbi:uncharacterized protein RHOBADRAFT_66035, partial [Rhodotorula graminis WP1]
PVRPSCRRAVDQGALPGQACNDARDAQARPDRPRLCPEGPGRDGRAAAAVGALARRQRARARRARAREGAGRTRWAGRRDRGRVVGFRLGLGLRRRVRPGVGRQPGLERRRASSRRRRDDAGPWRIDLVEDRRRGRPRPEGASAAPGRGAGGAGPRAVVGAEYGERAAHGRARQGGRRVPAAVLRHRRLERALLLSHIFLSF